MSDGSARSRPLSPPVRSASDFAGRVSELTDLAAGRHRVIAVTHDNPDPDALSAAWGLVTLLQERLDLPGRIAYGGIVGRAENRALVRELHLPLTPLHRIEWQPEDLVILVDTQPGCGNHGLRGVRAADAVVDHHPPRPDVCPLAFMDVGGPAGATASIVTSYLRAAGTEVSSELATALFYGIKSDTRDLGRESEPTDIENYHWLFPQIDHGALSRIEHPRLPASYFAAFHHAIGQARLHDDAVVCDMGSVYAPDIVAEVADRLLSLQDVRWTLVLGRFDDTVYLSARGSDRRYNVGRLIRRVVEPHGSAGGHGSMAGAQIPVSSDAARRKALVHTIIASFLREVEAPVDGVPLIGAPGENDFGTCG